MSLNPTAAPFNPSDTPPAVAATTPSNNPQGMPPADPPAKVKGSVKNLTCHFWLRGNCRYSAEDCSYAHTHTGRIAGGPVHLKRGGTCSTLYNRVTFII